MYISKQDVSMLAEHISKNILRLRQNCENVMNEVNKIVPSIVAVITEFIKEIEGLREVEELNAIVLSRLQNLNQAYSSQDIILLADVLQYEILDLLYFYIEIIDNREYRYVPGN